MEEASDDVSYGTETTVSTTGMMNVVTPLLSVLTAGISGSARLHEKLGNTEALRAVDRCIKRIERSVEAFGGRVVSASSEEVMAVFDTVDAAIHSAIEMQQRVADLPPVSGVKTAIRVGISCGEMDISGKSIDEQAAREAALLAGMAKPAQILASHKIRESISPSFAPQLNDLGPALGTTSGGQNTVLEIVNPHTPTAPSEATGEKGAQKPDAEPSGTGCLRLRYRGDTVLLNEGKAVILMGRDSACDLVIHDRRASRHHATIERRGTQVVLIDKSTNGTYVMSDGLPEIFVKRSECILRGKGQILFAASSTDPDADCAEFELI